MSDRGVNDPRILLVRLREIGDVVFTTPAVHALRRRFPHAYLAYLVEPHAAAIVQRHPDLDDVIVAPRRRGISGLLADFAMARTLRARQFDLAIDFHGGPRASLLTWLSGAADRIGYTVAGRSWMYTRRIGRPRALRARHSVDNQWDLLRALEIEPPDREHDGVTMAVHPEVAAGVARRLAAAGVDAAHRVVVIHVSAGNPFRRWPLEHFVALVASLARHASHRIVLTSGPSDRDAAARAADGARAVLPADAAARVLSIGDFSLEELRALLDRAALFIGGDSGPLHVAATSRVPVVGLYGPTLPERSAPWRSAALTTISLDAGALPCRPCDQRVCAPGDFRCLTLIRPEIVADAALRCLM